VPDYPQAITPVGHVEPVPRRVRALLGGQTVLDTSAARYVWEWPFYPQFYVPLADVAPGVLVDEGVDKRRRIGPVRQYGLTAGGQSRPAAAWAPTSGELEGTVHLEWSALDASFEEDELVFVHPRNPYTRVDALRSTRTVRVELDGVLLAESSSPVLVFETGLPTRYYLNRTEVDFTHLTPTDTVTACPYKGTTSGYWTAHLSDTSYPDIAWTYEFPTLALGPIAGLIAFYNEKVDTFLDGQLIDRPVTHFS